MKSTDPLESIEESKLFGVLDDEKSKIIKNDLSTVSLAKGETLFEQGMPSDAMYLVLAGDLVVYGRDADGTNRLKGKTHAGEPIGEIQYLTGGTHTATVRADTEARLAKLPRSIINRLAAVDPETLPAVADFIRKRTQRYRLYETLPSLFGELDGKTIAEIEDNIEWLRIDGGERLFGQGETGDSLYIVISGRLQAAVEDEGGARRVVGEITRGESVGEMALFTGEERSASIYAVRDTELIRFSKPAFDRIATRYPQVVMQIAQILISRLRKNISSSAATESLNNIAIVPASGGVDLRGFTKKLIAALSIHDQAIMLNSETVDRNLGTPGIAQTAATGSNNIRLETWLDDQESKYAFVIYESDREVSNWSRRCLRQADRILLVANAEDDPSPEGVEADLLGPEGSITTCCRHLVLLHNSPDRLPLGTLKWLEARSVEQHFHLCPAESSHFERLARILTGRGLGLVLGGGGARGYAHIGVIRALEEAGVPVDMIGGTSMGAVVAAAHAMGLDYREFVGRTKKLLKTHRPFKEYTLPIVSVLRSRRLDSFLHEAFGDANIEDLWVNFYCVATNLSAAEVRVHDRGSVWRAVRSSMSVPGIAVPIVIDHNLIVDGGILNNLPGDIMKKKCSGTVVAVDVSSKNDLIIDDSCNPIPSPWKIIWSRINPFMKTINSPSILSVMGRASLLGSISKRNEVMKVVDLYLNPPVSRFGMLENAAIEDIAQAGYQYAKVKIREWLSENKT